jgi:hypothetical protein
VPRNEQSKLLEWGSDHAYTLLVHEARTAFRRLLYEDQNGDPQSEQDDPGSPGVFKTHPPSKRPKHCEYYE